jgi:hypothetical protein
MAEQVTPHIKVGYRPLAQFYSRKILIPDTYLDGGGTLGAGL